jgi:hypothetical protein
MKLKYPIDFDSLSAINVGFHEFVAAAAPATPATGMVRIYVKADKTIAIKNDAGTETVLGAGGGGGISDGDTLTTGLTFPNGGLHILDTNATHDLIITPGSNLTADRVFTITTGDAARTLSMAGNITTAADFITSGANSLTLTTTGATNVTLPTTGTLATLAGTEALTGKSINGLSIMTTTGNLTIANGSTLATSGANSITLTSTAPTNVTLPTTGTLATLAGAEAFTNKTISGGTINNAVIGGSTPAAGTFTALQATGNLTVDGDLLVSGNTVTFDTATISVEDPLIKLAKNNSAADAVDIGLYGLYDTSGSLDLYGGIFRDATDGKWRLFKDLQTEPTTTVNTAGTGYAVATIVANVEGTVTGNVTGNCSGSAGSVAVGSITGAGTGVLTALAVNVGSAGAVVVNGGAGGTPSSLTLTNATGLPTAGLVDAAVTLAKMANLAQDQFIGRTTASTGVPQTATITAAARTVLDDTTVSAMLDTLGGASALGTGGVVRGTSPTITTPTISGAITFPDGVRQTFNPDGTNAGLNVGSQAGDPSAPSNGDLWYDSTANELTARINGANVVLGAGGSGACVQRKVTEITAETTTTSTIPADNTIPQSGEGAALASAPSITPASTSNYLEIEFSSSVTVINGTGYAIMFAVFLDSEASARYTAWQVVSGSDHGSPTYLKYRVLAPSTSAQTWKIRWGVISPATAYINRLASGSYWGGTARAYFSVTEYTP